MMPVGLAHWLAQAAISTIDRVWQGHPEVELTSSDMEQVLAAALARILGDHNKVIEVLITSLPRNSREQAMVITKLEEAQMWLERPARRADKEDSIG